MADFSGQYQLNFIFRCKSEIQSSVGVKIMSFAFVSSFYSMFMLFPQSDSDVAPMNQYEPMPVMVTSCLCCVSTE